MECRDAILIPHPRSPQTTANIGNEIDALHIDKFIIESNTSARVKHQDDTDSRENQNKRLGKLEVQAILRAHKLDYNLSVYAWFLF